MNQGCYKHTVLMHAVGLSLAEVLEKLRQAGVVTLTGA